MATPARITVYVVKLSKNHKCYSYQWVDSVTKKRRTESSGFTSKTEARDNRKAFEAALNARMPHGDGLVKFGDFISVYDESQLALRDNKEKSRGRILSILGIFEKEMEPASLGVITSGLLAEYVGKLKKAGRASTTIRTHLNQLAAAFQWAVEEGYLTAAPKMPKIGRPKGTRAKGRPLTDAEFVKMLRATSSVVGRRAARSWRRLLIGLWLSGLRLEEAVILVWGDVTQHHSTLWVDTTSAKYPLLGITAESEKGDRDRLLPLTKDFGQWLLKTPKDQRTGFVFPLVKRRHKDDRNLSHVSQVICEIGEKSGVVVNASGKFASAHDLRRTFGLRWAQTPGITPAELQQLMRHADIATTMKFYALVEATSFAEKLWNLDSTTTTTPKNDDSTQT